MGWKGSYRFLDPNFETFFQTFCQNNNFFFQAQSYPLGDQYTFKKLEQSVFHDTLQTYYQD